MYKEIGVLLQKNNVTLIEKHLFYRFLIHAKIDFTISPLLTIYFQDFKEDLFLNSLLSKIQPNTLKELEHYLELLIPQNDKKINGAFFTPDYIIDFMIGQLSPEEHDQILDPSCGSGAFLIGLIRFYQKKFKKKIKDIVRDHIFGVDILAYNVTRAKLLLTIAALENSEILEDADFNIITHDSLRADWATLFSKSKHDRFDIVLGNPPYVKFQDLSDENRAYLSQNWNSIGKGTFNLYFAFFELGYDLLKSTGKLAYITPNNYFTSLAGESLRHYLQSRQSIYRIVDFNHIKIFAVQTYTAITFLNKNKNSSILYDRINGDLSPEKFLMHLRNHVNSIDHLQPKKWRLLKTDEQENIKKIEKIGIPLKHLFDICVGIATLKDQLYFIDSSNRKNDSFYYKIVDHHTFEIEAAITRNIYKISDFKDQYEYLENHRKIIFPYEIRNGKAYIIAEAEMQKRFPRCYAYFVYVKDQLQKRDKGKKNISPFYAYGRSQGLSKTGIKILTPTFSQLPRFIKIEKDVLFCNGYGVFFKKSHVSSSFWEDAQDFLSNVENVDIILKILNSSIMHYYITRTSISIEGGYFCYQKNFIEKFTIPNFCGEELEILRGLEVKDEIDDFLIKKYHLSI